MKSFIIPAVFFTALLTGCSKSDDNKTAVKADSQKIIFEDANVKVTEYTAIPGGNACGAGMHSHLKHTTTLLTDAEVEITLPDGTKVPATLPTGATFWEDAGTHQVINKGDKPIISRITEIK